MLTGQSAPSGLFSAVGESGLYEEVVGSTEDAKTLDVCSPEFEKMLQALVAIAASEPKTNHERLAKQQAAELASNLIRETLARTAQLSFAGLRAMNYDCGKDKVLFSNLKVDERDYVRGVIQNLMNKREQADMIELMLHVVQHPLQFHQLTQRKLNEARSGPSPCPPMMVPLFYTFRLQDLTPGDYATVFTNSYILVHRTSPISRKAVIDIMRGQYQDADNTTIIYVKAYTATQVSYQKGDLKTFLQKQPRFSFYNSNDAHFPDSMEMTSTVTNTTPDEFLNSLRNITPAKMLIVHQYGYDYLKRFTEPRIEFVGEMVGFRMTCGPPSRIKPKRKLAEIQQQIMMAEFYQGLGNFKAPENDVLMDEIAKDRILAIVKGHPELENTEFGKAANHADLVKLVDNPDLGKKRAGYTIVQKLIQLVSHLPNLVRFETLLYDLLAAPANKIQPPITNQIDYQQFTDFKYMMFLVKEHLGLIMSNFDNWKQARRYVRTWITCCEKTVELDEAQNFVGQQSFSNFWKDIPGAKS